MCVCGGGGGGSFELSETENDSAKGTFPYCACFELCVMYVPRELSLALLSGKIKRWSW